MTSETAPAPPHSHEEHENADAPLFTGAATPTAAALEGSAGGRPSSSSAEQGTATDHADGLESYVALCRGNKILQR